MFSPSLLQKKLIFPANKYFDKSLTFLSNFSGYGPAKLSQNSSLNGKELIMLLKKWLFIQIIHSQSNDSGN